MRARSVSAFFAIATLASAGACRSFGEIDVDPGPGPGSTAEDGGVDVRVGTASDASQSGDPDAGSVSVDGGALTPPQIGTGCADRVPPWLVCVDFEKPETPTTIVINGTVGTTPAGGGSALRASTPSNGGTAYRPIPVPEDAKHVVWSFDVRLDEVVDGTQFGSLHLPGSGNDHCSVRIDLKSGKIRLIDFCQLEGEETTVPITELELPSPPDGWFNLFVDVDFRLLSVKASLRWPNGELKSAIGNIGTRTVVAQDATVQIGIADAPKMSSVDIDNVVVWWTK